jgi:hypothetical protein
VVIFDGDFVNLPWYGRMAKRAIGALERRTGAVPHRDPALAAEHAAILSRLPFRQGLTVETLRNLAADAGFRETRCGSYRPIARAQRRIAGPQDWLRTWLYRRFIFSATRS